MIPTYEMRIEELEAKLAKCDPNNIEELVKINAELDSLIMSLQSLNRVLH